MSNIRYSCRVLINLEPSRQLFGNSLNTKFHQNPSSGSEVVPRRRTEGHDEANSRFSQFCKRAQKYELLHNTMVMVNFFAGNSETSLGLQAKSPTSLSDSNQIWTPSTDFHRRAQYHIWREMRRVETALIQTDRHDEYNRRFTRLRERAQTRSQWLHVVLRCTRIESRSR
jgi:hypothetical protein